MFPIIIQRTETQYLNLPYYDLFMCKPKKTIVFNKNLGTEALFNHNDIIYKKKLPINN